MNSEGRRLIIEPELYIEWGEGDDANGMWVREAPPPLVGDRISIFNWVGADDISERLQEEITLTVVSRELVVSNRPKLTRFPQKVYWAIYAQREKNGGISET